MNLLRAAWLVKMTYYSTVTSSVNTLQRQNCSHWSLREKCSRRWWKSFLISKLSCSKKQMFVHCIQKQTEMLAKQSQIRNQSSSLGNSIKSPESKISKTTSYKSMLRLANVTQFSADQMNSCSRIRDLKMLNPQVVRREMMESGDLQAKTRYFRK